MKDKSKEASNLLVIIVNYKTAELTLSCLRSLEPELKKLPRCHVTVVDNASGDGSLLHESIQSRAWSSWVTLEVATQNGGFAAGNNVAIRRALASANPPRFFLLLNSDTEVRPSALRILLDFMEAHPEIGIAGSGIENPDSSPWPIAFRFITPLSQLVSGLRLGFVDRLLPNYVVARQMEQNLPVSVDWVAGASMIVRREVFTTIGLLDEGYFLYFEEVDFCLRARRAGWPCWYIPQSRIMHIGGESSGLIGISGKGHSLSPSVKVPRVPSYWFNSRRRYFLKNFGLWRAIVADLAFGFAFALWRLRRLLQRKPDFDPPHMLADFWRHSVLLGGPWSVEPPAPMKPPGSSQE